MAANDWTGMSRPALVETLELYRHMAARYGRLLSDALLENTRLIRELREIAARDLDH